MTFSTLAAALAPVPTLGPDWLDPATMITTFVNWVGPWAVLGVVLVIFAETGLLIGFFLPGDSLLFTLGMFLATSVNPADPSSPPVIDVPLWLVCLLVFIAAFTGDQVGYLIGRKAGPKIFDKPDSRLFKREYVERTNRFFAKHGGKTIILARFVPIVRTFAPVAAGVGDMHYRRFVSFNVFGGLLWAPTFTVLGYFLGQLTWVAKNIDYVIIIIVFVSILPMIVEALRSRLKSRRAAATDAATGEEGTASDSQREDSAASADQLSAHTVTMPSQHVHDGGQADGQPRPPATAPLPPQH